MPRKRTPKPTPTETETEIEAPATAATETHPKPQIEAQGAEPVSAAVLEPPVEEFPEQPQSFVERLQRQRGTGLASDPFGIAGDYVAGVRLFEARNDRLMVVKFEQKPGQEVLELLKDAGYRWNPRDKVWVHPIRPESARATRIEAERLYQEVRGMIRQDKGIDTGQEVPF